MTVDEIKNYYSSYINNIKATYGTNNVNLQQSTDSQTSITSLTDQLSLGSSLDSTAGYLNYGSNGQYTMQPDLAQLLEDNSGNDAIDLLGSTDLSDNSLTNNGLTDQMPDLADYLNSGDSQDDQSGSSSLGSIFDELAQSTIEYNSYLISNAVSKLNGSGSASTGSETADTGSSLK